MRSRASVSASSARRSQAAAAASISAAATRRPILSRSMRSNFAVSSISARSPRARTSAMMARTACSTSSRGLALGGEKRGKARGEVGGSAVEANRHRACPAGTSPGSRVNGARPRARQPCLERVGGFGVHVDVEIVVRAAFGAPGRARDRPVRPPGIRPRAAAPPRRRRSA